MSTRKFGAYSFEAKREDKILFPKAGFAKADLMNYYEAVSEYMVPHLRGRPLTLQRFPDGVGGEGFIQQQASDYFPQWLNRFTVDKEDGVVTHAVCNNKATLVYLASQACITLHTWLSRTDRLRHPDRLILDLDPPGKAFKPVSRAAILIRDYAGDLGLRTFVMSTGSRGLHVVIPLDRSATFDEARDFAKAIARRLAGSHPDDLTVEQRKAKRRGRVYLDIMRNSYGQTAVSPYSVRAKQGAPVAVPLTWKEVEAGSVGPRSFDIRSVLDRLQGAGDPWKGIGRHGQSLAKAAAALREPA